MKATRGTLAVVTAAGLVVGLSGPASAGPKPRARVIAETVAAECTFSSPNWFPVPQQVGVSLDAQDVLLSTEPRATCSSTIRTVKKLVKKTHFNKATVAARGFRCRIAPPDVFTYHYVCNLRSDTVTRVRLEFDLILD